MKTVKICSLFVLSLALAFGHDLQAQARRGWTPQTRGTLVGAGLGGAAGAIINKQNRLVGAAVGGVVGGVAGSQLGKNQRRRWSPQAKGAVIGTGVGAAAGAIIHKRNRVLGGVVGGVLGGAGGYAVGKHVDNRNKKAAREAAARAEAERMAAAKTAEVQPQVANSVVLPEKATRPYAFVSYQPATAPVMSAASLPTASLTTTGLGYLLNTSYGDMSTPYPTSELRRKSW
ncbi:MAG: YMGG-like glycine zipper-containing protein [Cytophagaceae bacterium]|nr:YMGG-like glycine zipper-containing protein [Cytophagaceae bacterium]